jgi:hypothetical protein
MNSLKILYLGGGAFYDDQCNALRRCGHDVLQIDPNLPWSQNRFLWRWIYETGGAGIGRIVRQKISKAVAGWQFDVVWVGGGQLVNCDLLDDLRNRCLYMVNYNPDNPYVPRDRQLWRLFKTTVSKYDLLVVPRRSNIDQARALGAREVRFEYFAADDRLIPNVSAIDGPPPNNKSGVVFVGTWMPGRGAFLLKLIEKGVPLRIYGQRWRRAPEYKSLRAHIVDGSIWGPAYRDVIASAEIAIGLLSEGNCDLHTTRSVEIPAIGTVLCAKRTADHEKLYRDEKEAIFWDDADDCALKCLNILADVDRLNSIARAGRARALRNNNFNEALVTNILSQLHSGGAK